MKKSPAKILLLIGGFSLLCLVLCIFGLMISANGRILLPVQIPTGLLAHSTVTPASTPTIPPTGTPTFGLPTALPPTLTFTPAPTDTATPDVAMIPGLLPADLQSKLEQRKLSCSPIKSSIMDRQNYFSWSCTRDDFDIQYFVSFTSRSLYTVDAINALVIQSSIPDGKLQAAFLGNIATWPFPNQPDLQIQARTWVEQTLSTITGNPGDGQRTTINGVTFQLFGPPSARTLFIGTMR